MKILHVALSGKFSDNWLYQENLLTKQNAVDGNDTVIVATTDRHFSSEKNPKESVYVDSNSVKVYRIKSPGYIPSFLQAKLRFYPRLSEILCNEAPDVIFHHGVQSLSLLLAVSYVKSHPGVKLYADSHSDYMNSARNFISKWILNKLIYRALVRFSLPYIDKIFYVTKPRKGFLLDMYNLPESKLEFMPLGGFEIPDSEYGENRRHFREKYKIGENDVVFLHAGKFCADKRTSEVIDIFENLDIPNAKLVLAGRGQNGYALRDEFHSSNIINLGWVSPENMHALMCGCDVFLQPGLHSVIFEQAALCRMALILADMEHNRFLMGDGNGVLVCSDDDIKTAVCKLSCDFSALSEMKANVRRFAAENLLYSKILEGVLR